LGFRVIRLSLGLVGVGVSLALLVDAHLGLDPWDVLNQGIARHLGIQTGWVVDAMVAIVLLAWVPLRQRPGVGTLVNIVVVGLLANAALDVFSVPEGLFLRAAVLVVAIVLNDVATGCTSERGLALALETGLRRAWRPEVTLSASPEPPSRCRCWRSVSYSAGRAVPAPSLTPSPSAH
jgi:uncharacterized membrane protein YczE